MHLFVWLNYGDVMKLLTISDRYKNVNGSVGCFQQKFYNDGDKMSYHKFRNAMHKDTRSLLC